MKIGIIFGGLSYEHEISIVSAIAVKDVIKNHSLSFIFLDENRDFYLIPNDKMKSKLFSSGDYKKCEILDIDKNGFYTKGGFFSKEKKVDIDIVVSTMHGGDGEDGILNSMLDFYNIPFMAPRTEACVVSSNKYLTKSYASECKVKTIDFKFFTKNDKVKVDKYPCIVKPVKLGSSIGVSVVNNDKELDYACDVAFEFDDAIIIEPFIPGVKEYNLAGCKVNGEFEFSIIEEPQKTDFLDFDKKYLDFARTSTAQKAPVDEKIEAKLKEAFTSIYNTFFEGSLIRCDFFVVNDEVYLNEINSIPGSLANYLFEDFNKTFDGLLNSLPSKKRVPITYEYVNKIHANKGK